MLCEKIKNDFIEKYSLHKGYFNVKYTKYGKRKIVFTVEVFYYGTKV